VIHGRADRGLHEWSPVRTSETTSWWRGRTSTSRPCRDQRLFTITPQNGDTIFGTYSGQAEAADRPGVIRYLATGPVTGGTGRFEGAPAR
jgi:hypothetical protein